MADTDGIRLVTGLGNPGPRYDHTRHNAGFWFADALAASQDAAFRTESRFRGDACRIETADQPLWLFKPGAYMNRSGPPLASIASFYKIPPARVLVAHDDIDLPPGTVRLKRGGGHGGHNGLRDVFAHFGRDFWRLRLGVGHPGHRDQVVDYVLSEPSASERDAILSGIDTVLPLMDLLAGGEMEKAMHQLHSRKSPDDM